MLRAKCKTYNRTGQARNFDSNSRWVPILLYTRQHILNRHTTASEHRPTTLIDVSRGASRPQLAHNPHLKRSQRSSVVVDAPTPRSPQDAVKKATRRARTKLSPCVRTANKDWFLFPLQRATKGNRGGQGARRQKTSSKAALSSLVRSIPGSREGACTSPCGNEQGVGALMTPGAGPMSSS